MSLSYKSAVRNNAFVQAQFPVDFKCPSPEGTAVGVKYTFTYNLNDMYNLTQPLQHAKVIIFFDQVKDILHNLKGCGITMFPEFSKRGRLHFHGYLTIKNKVLFYAHDVNYLQLHGNYEIDYITDPLLWDLYIHKNAEMMDDYFATVNCTHLKYDIINSNDNIL